MGIRPEPVKPQTLDIGPGQYFKQDVAEGGVTIPKAGRGQFYQATDSQVGPGQYATNISTLNKTGVSFKGTVAALHGQ